MGPGWIKKGEFLTWRELEETEKKIPVPQLTIYPILIFTLLSIFETADCIVSPKVTTIGHSDCY